MVGRITLMMALVLMTGRAIAAQTNRVQLFVAPSDSYLLAVASQPDCPLQIEGAKLLLSVKHGGWAASYQLRNRSSAPLRIRLVKLSMWSAQGAGSSWEDLLEKETGTLVMPGEAVPIHDDRPVEIVPLTVELRAKLKLNSGLRAVVVLMIDQVQVVNGTSFDASKTAQALEKYFENIELSSTSKAPAPQ
jgi:hypothetical protein